MEKLTRYPNWRELVEIIAAQEKENPASLYPDETLAAILECPAGSSAFAFSWMKCRECLLNVHGIDFRRIRGPVRGYKAMTAREKATQGFQRRMDKTRRNAKRMTRVIRSVDRRELDEGDARAYDSNMAKAGLLASIFRELPRGVKSLRLTVEIDRELPKLK